MKDEGGRRQVLSGRASSTERDSLSIDDALLP
jgi:hypothetical protein